MLIRRVIYALYSQPVIGFSGLRPQTYSGLYPWIPLGDFRPKTLICPPLEKISGAPFLDPAGGLSSQDPNLPTPGKKSCMCPWWRLLPHLNSSAHEWEPIWLRLHLLSTADLTYLWNFLLANIRLSSLFAQVTLMNIFVQLALPDAKHFCIILELLWCYINTDFITPPPPAMGHRGVMFSVSSVSPSVRPSAETYFVFRDISLCSFNETRHKYSTCEWALLERFWMPERFKVNVTARQNAPLWRCGGEARLFHFNFYEGNTLRCYVRVCAYDRRVFGEAHHLPLGGRTAKIG